MLTAPRRASARLFVALVPVLAAACGGGEGSPPAGAPSTGVAARIDSLADARLKTGRIAGLSIGVMKGNDTLVMKGYGSADLELDVPTPAHAVYEIGSITKQFTAAAILQLRDDGKLSLDDDFTKYVPWPTQGHTISIRRLLDHTSGIKGYTEMPAFGALMARDLPKDSLLELVKKEKFSFPTGEAMIYNNSAYYLAGLVVEKVSGMSYADYVQKTFFDKVGMKDASYCSEKAITKRKVKGYDMNPDSTLRLRAPIAHVWPYAAGSLCGSIHDLVAWNRALHSGKVLSPAAYTDFTTPGVLNDGTRLRYAAGVALRQIAGHRAIEHAGGINGFIVDAAHFPDDSLTIVVLTNTAGTESPTDILEEITAIVLGKAAPADSTYTGDLAALAGTYVGTGRGPDLTLVIKPEGQVLTVGMPPRPGADTLHYTGNNTWRRGEDLLTFVMSGDKATTLRVDQTYGYMFLRRKD